MNKVVVVLILLLIIGLAGAFFYISKLRKAREDRIKQLQTVTGQVSSLKSSLQSAETQAENEARQLKQEKKAKKAELTRIEAERKAEIAKRDALDKMKNAKIAELAEKQKRHEAEIAKTDERRKAAIREADEARAKAKAARSQADAAISEAKKSKSLADRAKQVADARTRQADVRTRQADVRTRQAAARVSQADARTRQAAARANKEMARMRQRAASEQTKLSGVVSSIRGANVRRAFENARTYNAVPGYFTTGYQFAGDVFGIADPRVCKSLAVTRRHKMWGHRNALHGSPRYKNSCYFYKNGPRFKGNGNDDVHMVGCAFGGSIQNGCTNPPAGPETITKTGRCGPGHGRCPGRSCCSRYGWCGGQRPTRSAWCSRNIFRTTRWIGSKPTYDGRG